MPWSAKLGSDEPVAHATDTDRRALADRSAEHVADPGYRPFAEQVLDRHRERRGEAQRGVDRGHVATGLDRSHELAAHARPLRQLRPASARIPAAAREADSQTES